MSAVTRQLRVALSPLRTAVSFAQQSNTFALVTTTVPGIAMIGVAVAGASRSVGVGIIV